MSASSIENNSSPKSVDGISRSVRVLVVDNDIVHARTMGEGLERLGYSVIVAGGGKEGAQQIRDDSFDVVVTDLMMNDIGGLEILKEAKTSSVEQKSDREAGPEARVMAAAPAGSRSTRGAGPIEPPAGAFSNTACPGAG